MKQTSQRLASAAVVLLVASALSCSVFAEPSAPGADVIQRAVCISAEAALPRTDGDCLPAPPSAFEPLEAARLFAESRQACQGPCATPFGQVLGIADGAEARSNCRSQCVQPEMSYLNLATGLRSTQAQEARPKTEPRPELQPEPSQDPGQQQAHANERPQYVGITYQCVGYARYWWMKNRSLTFGDVDDAHHILYLTEGTDVRTGERVPLARSINGSARRPPRQGDLLIYAADRDNPDWRFGHVAVIVAVDRDRGLVALAEENYYNRSWQDPDAFARQIQLFEVNGRFTLLDIPDGRRKSASGGRIVGWIYPAP